MSSKIKYRKLMVGEYVREGDEYTAYASDSINLPPCFERGSEGWIYTSQIGQVVSAGQNFRRKITSDKLPTTKPRRESLTARIATAIQTGQNKPAMDTAREVMRLVDNHQRAKRRKEGK